MGPGEDENVSCHCMHLDSKHGRGFGRQGVLVPAACPRVPGPALTIIAHHMCFSEQKGWTSGGMGWGGDESVPCHCARGDYDSVGQDALRTWSVLWKTKSRHRHHKCAQVNYVQT